MLYFWSSGQPFVFAAAAVVAGSVARSRNVTAQPIVAVPVLAAGPAQTPGACATYAPGDSISTATPGGKPAVAGWPAAATTKVWTSPAHAAAAAVSTTAAPRAASISLRTR